MHFEANNFFFNGGNLDIEHVVLAPGKTDSPPITLNQGTFTSTLVDGAIEYSNNGLYFTNNNTRRRLLLDGDVTGGGTNVTNNYITNGLVSITDISGNGGTGFVHSVVNNGIVLNTIHNGDGIAIFDNTSNGRVDLSLDLSQIANNGAVVAANDYLALHDDSTGTEVALTIDDLAVELGTTMASNGQDNYWQLDAGTVRNGTAVDASAVDLQFGNSLFASSTGSVGVATTNGRSAFTTNGDVALLPITEPAGTFADYGRVYVSSANNDLYYKEGDNVYNLTNGTLSGGETNTASNVGAATNAEIFVRKSGVDFEFNSLNGTEGIAVVNGANSEVTFALDVGSLADNGAITTSSDYLVIYDGSSHRRALIDEIATGEINTNGV